MTVARLLKLAGPMFGTNRAELVGDCRAAPVARARFAVYWAARKGLGVSYPGIGRAIGDRDHSTVIYGCKRAEKMRANDADFAAKSDALRAAVERAA